jgi:hypothetical protein
MAFYIVNINWPAGGREIVPLGNLENLRAGEKMMTVERGSAAESSIRYSTTLASIKSTCPAEYTILLGYKKDENQGLALQNEYWGMSEISINTELLTATAIWTDDRKDNSYNATVDAEILIEPAVVERTKRWIAQTIRDTENTKIVRALDLTCALTDEATPETLDVAHILEVSSNGSDSLSNCFLLRTDLHRLFDAGYLRFAENGNAYVAPGAAVSEEYKELISSKTLRLETLNRVRDNLSKRMKYGDA